MEGAVANGDLAQITRTNQVNSPLLRLPAELRNQIYAYVFRGSSVRVWGCFGGFSAHMPLYYGHGRAVTAILRCCRQIRLEAQDLYIATTTFSSTMFGIGGLIKDFEPRKLGLITSVECAIDNWYLRDWGQAGGDEEGTGDVATGALVGLKRVHILKGKPWQYVDREMQRVPEMLEKVMGRRVGVDEVDVTVSHESVVVWTRWK